MWNGVDPEPKTPANPYRMDHRHQLAGKCRNRTYQPPCEGLSGFEDRASHQTRTLPCWRKPLSCKGSHCRNGSLRREGSAVWSLFGHFAPRLDGLAGTGRAIRTAATADLQDDAS